MPRRGVWGGWCVHGRAERGCTRLWLWGLCAWGCCFGGRGGGVGALGRGGGAPSPTVGAAVVLMHPGTSGGAGHADPQGLGDRALTREWGAPAWHHPPSPPSSPKAPGAGRSWGGGNGAAGAGKGGCSPVKPLVVLLSCGCSTAAPQPSLLPGSCVLGSSFPLQPVPSVWD